MTKVLASATIFSLFADPPAALPAPIPGSEGALDAAVLVGESDRLDVAIRRFSAAGAVLSLPAALEPGEAWILELRNGQCIEGSVAWATGTEAGFAFARTIDVVGILARNLAILPAERRSVPRVELRQIVGIRCGGEFELARARDISQAGVGIDTALHLAPDDEVQIAFDGLPSLAGKVRWSRGNQAGIAFDDALAWQVLMPWLRQTQRNPSRAANAAPLRALHEEVKGFGLSNDKHAIRVDAPARVREGAHWWNVRVRNITPHLVEFEAEALFDKGAQLWVELPRIAGWPATVIDGDGHGHYLAEFRLPLRQHDLAQLGGPRQAIS